MSAFDDNETGVKYYLNQDYNNALIYFKSAVSKNPSDKVMLYNLGNTHFALSQFTDSVNCYKKAILIDGAYADALNQLNTALGHLKNVTTIKSVYNEITSKYPNNYDLYNFEGAVLTNTGFHQDAVNAYDKCLKIMPSFTHALNNKLISLNSLGDQRKIIDHCHEILQHEIKNDKAWSDKGLNHYYLGESDNAMFCINKAIELSPNNPHYLNTRAIVNLDWSKSEEAMVDLKKAITFENNIHFHGNLGIAYYNLHRDLEALQEYDVVLAVEPNNVVQLNNKSQALIHLNRDDEAIATFEKCISVEPTYTIAIVNLAVLYEKKGLYGKTLDLLRKAEEALKIDKRSSYANKLFITEQMERISLLAEKLNNIQANLAFSEKVLEASGKPTDEVRALKKSMTIISDDHASHEKNILRKSGSHVIDEKSTFEALLKRLDALEISCKNFQNENSELKSKVESLEARIFKEVNRVEQNLHNKFSVEIEKQGKDAVDKVMAKLSKSGGSNNHDEAIKEIIKELKELKMENKYLLDVIDSLENNK